VTYETHAGRDVDGCCARSAEVEAEAEENGNGSEKGKKEFDE
jgi:hypothetical protein